MALTITHAHVATGTDAGNGEVHKAEWNAAHDISGTLSADDVVDGTTNKAYTATEKTKLAGIASGATANTGDVTAASNFGTDNRLLRSDGTGKGSQSSGITLDDSDNISWFASISGTIHQGINFSFLDVDQSNYGTFTLSSNITANRTYNLSMPDGSYTYTFPAASVTFASLNLEDQTLTGGARVTVKDLGNTSGNTITPDPGDRAIQKVTNNGSWTFAPGSNVGCYLISVINTTGAAVPTTSGFTKVDGVFDNTTTSKFHCAVTVTGDYSVLQILKVV